MNPEFNKLFQLMVQKNASDMHLRSGSKPYLRISSKISPVDECSPLSKEQILQLALSLMSEEQKKLFYERHECDLAITLENLGRFRINAYLQRGVINLAIRYIPIEIPSIEELNLPSVIKKLAENQRGILLVTGQAGSGKTTTLAAVVDYINSTRACHIITIEDPIEFIHRDKKSIISQRELGFDTLSYTDALRHVVRQNPDVILIGEMRDLETIQTALTAAQLGHLVLSTLHTIDAIQTVSRIIDMFPPHHQPQIRLQLSDTLVGVISQRLLNKSSGDGLIPAVEILVATPIVKKYILENNLNEISTVLKQGQYYGMQTFDQVILQLYREGKITIEEALKQASTPEDFMLAVKGIKTSTEAATELTLERFGSSK